MTRHVTRLVLVVAVLLAVGTLAADDPQAYSLLGAKWNRTVVDYYINTANLDLPGAAVEAAVRAGADSWAQQANVNFAFNYAGPSGITTTTWDNLNVVMFRNAANGAAIATTYFWSSSGVMVDADIVFWDGGFRFFSGTTGCSSGFYIEDIAAHEFGHALGMDHSSVTGATMFPSVSSCNQANRSLDADDIAGALALYGARVGTVPTAPLGLRISGS